jgi:hypothetical protein
VEGFEVVVAKSFNSKKACAKLELKKLAGRKRTLENEIIARLAALTLQDTHHTKSSTRVFAAPYENTTGLISILL